jgi:hypothetical protein
MTSRILLALFLFIVSSVFANTITRGHVLQVHRDGRVVNVPLGRAAAGGHQYAEYRDSHGWGTHML